jgi:hypothetical protein
MWLALVLPVVVVAVITVVGLVARPPSLPGMDPEGLRTVVLWRDSAPVAADVAGEAHEQLRQLVGSLAERHYILSSSLDRGSPREGASARVDVLERRLEMCARPWTGGRWLLWIGERGQAPIDSDDLRQLLTGLHRTLEKRPPGAAAAARRARSTSNERPLRAISLSSMSRRQSQEARWARR